MDMARMVMDVDIEVSVDGVSFICTVGCSGVSYISGALCDTLGIDRSALKSSTVYTTLFPGERLRRMSIVPELTVKFPSGTSITHGPFVVDDAAPVPMQVRYIHNRKPTCPTVGDSFLSVDSLCEVTARPAADFPRVERFP